MGNSLMVGCAKMGLHFTACAPKKYQPDPELVAECEKIAETGATISFEEDPAKAAKAADVLLQMFFVSDEVYGSDFYKLRLRNSSAENVQSESGGH